MKSRCGWYWVVGKTAALVSGFLLATAPAYSTENAQERRGARDTKQNARQSGRAEKVDCRKADNKSNAECRQGNRDSRQTGRQDSREVRSGAAPK